MLVRRWWLRSSDCEVAQASELREGRRAYILMPDIITVILAFSKDVLVIMHLHKKT